MSFRPPASLLASASGDLLSALDQELAGEMADALGRAGRKAEIALLQCAEARGKSAEILSAAVDEAAQAVFALSVQRELCGMRNQAAMIRQYDIPKDVMARVGITRKA
ncbi:DUF6665 family protein [Rhizobium wuzhouense]|uniref:Uncharacterized protein n=1 Tax=Rhizobium wuzhouense TaxID=1986026 RepID=A0ABX5NQL7_9HYPH|nr:DUF6665 family protein [Rhizobium wuzhouense]PYB70081.1 hypothetical protein DMY87_22665 [Rhizobium wuzhouense]